jgi:hypothetical protein
MQPGCRRLPRLKSTKTTSLRPAQGSQIKLTTNTADLLARVETNRALPTPRTSAFGKGAYVGFLDCAPYPHRCLATTGFASVHDHTKLIEDRVSGGAGAPPTNSLLSNLLLLNAYAVC